MKGGKRGVVRMFGFVFVCLLSSSSCVYIIDSLAENDAPPAGEWKREIQAPRSSLKSDVDPTEEDAKKLAEKKKEKPESF